MKSSYFSGPNSQQHQANQPEFSNINKQFKNEISEKTIGLYFIPLASLEIRY